MVYPFGHFSEPPSDGLELKNSFIDNGVARTFYSWIIFIILFPILLISFGFSNGIS